MGEAAIYIYMATYSSGTSYALYDNINDIYISFIYI